MKCCEEHRRFHQCRLVDIIHPLNHPTQNKLIFAIFQPKFQPISGALELRQANEIWSSRQGALSRVLWILLYHWLITQTFAEEPWANIL